MRRAEAGRRCRAGYGHLPGEVKKSWLAGWLGIYQDLLST